MAGFPKLPLVNRDTDEDLSLHLHTQVGPSAPLPSKKTSQDDEMLKILNDDYNTSETNDFNKYFRQFQQTGRIGLVESSDDENETDDEVNTNKSVEQIDDVEEGAEGENKERDYEMIEDKNQSVIDSQEFTDAKINKPNLILFNEFKKVKENKSSGGRRSVVLLSSIVFSIAFGITLLMLNSFPSFGVALTDNMYNELSSKIKKLEACFTTINNNQGILESQYNGLIENIDDRLTAIEQNIQSIKLNPTNSEELNNLKVEFNKIKLIAENYDKFEFASDIDSKLNEMLKKIKILEKVNDDIDRIKTEVVDNFLSLLPKHVPIYLNKTDNTMHIMPEFQEYLIKLVGNYDRNYSWETFMVENESKLKDFIGNSSLSSKGKSKINKDELEKFIKYKVENLIVPFTDEFNKKIDALPLVWSEDLEDFRLGNMKEFYFDHLLKLFTKASIRVNYADYSLGARILGFLTNYGNITQKSFFNKVLTGWYELLKPSGKKSLKYWKYNANNALLDNSLSWNCESSSCSLGVRLCNPIVLTNIVVKQPKNNHLHLSLYIKTKDPHAMKLLDDFNRLKFDSAIKLNNKYLKDFVKVKEANMDSHFKIITLPEILKNERIPVKDIYIELNSDSNVELTHLQVFGIKEENSFREDFDDLVEDVLLSNSANDDSQTYFMFNEKELGTDENFN